MTKQDTYSVVQDAIEAMILKHGTLRAAARVLKVSAPYLCRLRKGEKREGSDKILKKLGVRRLVRYERIDGKPPAMPPHIARIYHGDIDGDLEGYDGA